MIKDNWLSRIFSKFRQERMPNMSEERQIPENPYKIGDRVKIVNFGHKIWGNDPLFTKELGIELKEGQYYMHDLRPELIGREGVIVDSTGTWMTSGNYLYKYSIDSVGAWFSEDQIELVGRLD